LETSLSKQLFYLKDFTYDTANTFTVTLWTPNHKRSEEFFVDKETELSEVSTFLQLGSEVNKQISRKSVY